LQVDCAVGEWSGWSQCDSAIGRQERTRFFVTPPSSDGRACPALDDAIDCMVACVLGEWAPWGECSASCGGGRRTRQRAVEVPAKHGGANCRSTEEADACNTAACAKKARTAHSNSGYTAQIASLVQVGELHDAVKNGDLAAVQARLRSPTTIIPGRDAVALQSLLAAGTAVNDRDSSG
jgi:hypothetical protein